MSNRLSCERPCSLDQYVMTAAPAAPLPARDPGAQHPVGIGALYLQVWEHAAGARGWLLLSSAMLVASQLVKLLVPWLTAQAINTLQRGHAGAAAACLPYIAGIVGAYVVCWALHGPGRVIERTVALRVRRSLTDMLYRRLSEAPLGWHGAHHPAELAHRVSQASHALTNFTQSQFIYLQNAVNLAGPLLALWWLSHVTGLAALAGFVAVALTIVVFDRAMMRLAQTENCAERSLSAAMLDCLSNITTVLSLRLQATTRRLVARRLEAVMAPVRRSIALSEWKWCAVDLLSVLLTWGLVVLYAWQQRSDRALLLGGVFMVYQYAQQAGGVIGSLASNLQNFARMRTDFASAAPILAAPRPRHSPKVPSLQAGSTSTCARCRTGTPPSRAGARTTRRQPDWSASRFVCMPPSALRWSGRVARARARCFGCSPVSGSRRTVTSNLTAWPRSASTGSAARPR